MVPDAKPWSIGTSESPGGVPDGSLHLPFLAVSSPIKCIFLV